VNYFSLFPSFLFSTAHQLERAATISWPKLSLHSFSFFLHDHLHTSLKWIANGIDVEQATFHAKQQFKVMTTAPLNTHEHTSCFLLAAAATTHQLAHFQLV